MTPEVFQAALERGDIETAGEMLDENVVFRSPAVFEPYEGKAATMVLLKAVSSVFQDFRYVRVVRRGARHGAGAGLRGQDRHAARSRASTSCGSTRWAWSTTSG